MNRLLYLLLLLLMSVLLPAQAILFFPLTNVSLDTMIEGELRTIKFPFQNRGNGTLLLSNVHSSCGCTVPAWKPKNILAGQWDTIQATYNSVGHLGNIGKTVYVESNGGKADLRIDGQVLSFEQDLRLYYGTGGTLVHYEVTKNDTSDHLYFDIQKNAEGKYSGDVSFVISNESLIPKILSIGKAEMEAKGIGIKVLRQANMSITYAEPYDNKLENKVSFIYRFSFTKNKNTSLHMLLDKAQILVHFNFEK